MLEEIEKLLYTLESGEVQRFHSAPSVLNKQCVGQHSWGVALIAAYIHGGEITSNLLLACLTHDAPELTTGDIPAPCKWKNNGFEESLNTIEKEIIINKVLGGKIDLTGKEYAALKLADSIEGMRWVARYEPSYIVYDRWAHYITGIIQNGVYENYLGNAELTRASKVVEHITHGFTKHA